jgi:hypothetical protein
MQLLSWSVHWCVYAQISGHILVDGKPRDEGFHHKIGYVEQVI